MTAHDGTTGREMCTPGTVAQASNFAFCHNDVIYRIIYRGWTK